MSSNKAGVKKSQQLSDVPTMQVSTAAKYVVVLATCIVLTLLVLFWIYQNNSSQRDTYNQLAELRLLSQQIAIGAQIAMQGDSKGIADFQQAQQQFQNKWRQFRSGSISAQSSERANTIWSGVAEQSQKITSKMQSVTTFQAQADIAKKSLLKIQKNTRELLTFAPSTSGVPRTINEHQLLLVDHLLFMLADVSNVQSNLLQDANAFERDLQSMRSVLSDQLQTSALGSESTTRQLLNDNYKLVQGLQAVWSELLPLINDMLRVKQVGRDIPDNTQALLAELTILMQKNKTGSPWLLLLGLVLAAVSVVTLILMFNRSTSQAKALLDAEASVRLAEEQANQRNQKAILRLLDELGDLADGDLTVETTVTEDFTGAIADSINFTIDQLRSLVSTINQTAVQVSSAAEATQNTAKALADASDHQAQEIAGASAAITEMALSIDQVSANAYESSAVAERSVSIAKKGSDVVQATIRGMDTIREQIQDTSKRMKRLGESSQEIGDIVSLINDIADQTNILALNAAIQASMAGDAGRGFAVVADEVQRLAERASAATKQIEALVKTIQNDTHEAVISMEQTTTQVVNGANLAQDAGVALEEIENVSSNLANLIQNISNAARQQAASAGQISNTMNVIQEITSQTSAGTSVTASSIGHLADLAVQMRTSVSGFKLPDQSRLI